MPYRKALARAATLAPDAVPLVVAVGNELLASRTYRLAAAVFFEAFRLAPYEPLIALSLSAVHIAQVGSRKSVNRHADAARGFAFLALYRRLRVEQHAALARVGPPAGRADVGDGAGPVAPLPLPPAVVEAETWFNVGRAMHSLSLLAPAAAAYERCLATADYAASAAPDGGAVASAAPSRTAYDARVAGALAIHREAAYNYGLLLRASGNAPRALAVAARFLSFD